MVENKSFSRSLIGRTVVSKSGKKFGVVGDLVFEIRTGELIYLVLNGMTPHAGGIDLEKTEEGNPMLPFSSVISVSDFVVVAEEDII